MAETNLGRVAIVPKGTYSASVQYYYLDLVYYQGSSYLVHTQPTIGTLPTDTDYFYLAAEGAELEMRYDSVTDYIQWKLITDVTWNNLIQPADLTPTIVQTTGTSTTDVMSQKAVTDELTLKIDKTSIINTQTDIGEGKTLDARQGKILKENIVNDCVYPVTTPIGYSWLSHPLIGKIKTNGKSRFIVDYDVRAHKPTAKSGYIAPNGNNANDGLSPQTPKQTVAALLSAYADIDNIIFAAGIYSRQTLTNINRSVGFIGATSGKTIFTASDALTWTLTSGKTKTYQATRTNTLQVVDFQHEDNEDTYRKYTLVSSIDDVEATAGTWFTTAGVVYVHTLDDAAPTNETIRALIDADAMILSAISPCNFYFENLLSVGGSQDGGSVSPSGVDCNVYMYNLRACYAGKSTSSAGNAFSFKNTTSVLQNCKAFLNSGDGFNYHATTGYTVKAIEINCVAYQNGATAGNDNGSTIHDGGKVMRINGVYCENRGPNIADVNTDTESWNLGCVAFASTCPSNENLGSVDYGFNAGNVKVWLDSCIGYSSTKSAIFGTTTDVVTAKVRNCKFEVTEEVGRLSTKTIY